MSAFELAHPLTGELTVGTRLWLDLPEGLPFDEWTALGERLCAGAKVINWWVGDWWTSGQHRYGERAKTTAQGIFGREFQTLRNIAAVCSAMETSRRRDTLSWSHHAEVAALPASEADALLDQAEQNGWSRRDLRAAVEQHRGIVNRTSFTGNNEWFTPAAYIERVRGFLGAIDLDPASSELAQRTVRAERFLSEAYDDHPSGDDVMWAFSACAIGAIMMDDDEDDDPGGGNCEDVGEPQEHY